MSRIGKIARLPAAVRDELNERLSDGEPQGQLVAWLNGREDVQAALKAHHDGRAINDQNLSAWVQGGFEEWKHQQASLDVASRFVEDTAAVADVMAKQAGPEISARGLLASFVTDRVAMMGALAIGELLMATRRMEDGAEKRGAILKIIRELVRLRHTDRQREQEQRQAEQAQRSAEMHEAWAENAGRRPPETGGERTEDGRRRAYNARTPRSIQEMSDAQIKAALVRLGRGPASATASARRAVYADDFSSAKPMGRPTAPIRPAQGAAGASEGERRLSDGPWDEETKRRLAPDGVPENWVYLGGGPAAAENGGQRTEDGGRGAGRDGGG